MAEDNIEASTEEAKKARKLFKRRIYAKANADKIKAANAAWRAANPDRMKAIRERDKEKRYGPHTIEAARKRRREIYAADPERFRSYTQKRRARRINSGGEHTKAEIAQLLKKQNGKCAACKSKVEQGYERDHILPLFLGGTNDIRNIQLLCRACNRRKSAKHPIAFAQELGLLL